jgi:hypothetical protein
MAVSSFSLSLVSGDILADGDTLAELHKKMIESRVRENCYVKRIGFDSIADFK